MNSQEEVDVKADIRNVPKHIIKELIRTYKSHPALWQIKNKDLYGKRHLKHKGYQALVKVWKQYDEDADIKTVKNKIQSLRGSFRKELKKVKNSQKSGSDTEDTYKSQLWYFSLMTFLIDNEQPTESSDNEQELTLEVTANEEKSAEAMMLCDIIYGNKHVPAKKKMKLEEEEKPKFLNCTTTLGNNETDTDAFGKFVSKKLEKIKNAEQKMYAESLITKIMNYAILNKLSEFTDIVSNCTTYLRDTHTGSSNTSANENDGSYDTME